ncbi:MAG: hypothetical protein AABY87_05985 [bacterium]|mgnify:CR=1 FL=1
MTIKQKLFTIVLIICSVLGLLVGGMIWSTQHNVRQIQAIGASLNHLYTLLEARFFVSIQMNHALDYLVTHHEQDKKNFEATGKKAVQALHNWIAEAGKSAIKNQGKGRDMIDQARSVQSDYQDVIDMVVNAFEFAGIGEQEEALDLMSEEVDPWMEDVLFKGLDEAITIEIAEVNDHYQEFLIKMGLMPWISQEGARQVKIAQAAIRLCISIDKISFHVGRQFNDLIHSLQPEKYDESKKNFQRDEYDAKLAIQAWDHALQAHRSLGLPGEDADLRMAQTVEATYLELLDFSDIALELQARGETAEALQLIDQKVEPLANHELLPLIQKALKESKGCPAQPNACWT